MGIPEKLALRSPNETSRSDSGYGNGRKSAALTMLKMAVFAPMPSASVSTATAVKPGFFSSWRRANFKSFITQGHHRIDSRGAARRNPAGKQRDAEQECRNDCESQRVGGAHTIQKARHQTRQCQRAAQTKEQTCYCQPHALPQHEFQHVRRFCTQCHSHTNFVSASRDRM